MSKENVVFSEIVWDIPDAYWRAYDIRGAGLTWEQAYKLGLAYGTKIAQKGYSYCIVGFDNRNNSEQLCNGLCTGLIKTGVNILRMGLGTTPQFYLALQNYSLPGMMITASHNPKQDNGFKIALDITSNAFGEAIQEFKRFTYAGIFKKATKLGKIIDIDIFPDYLNLFQRAFPKGCMGKPLKVVMDCGNGTTSLIVKEICDTLGLDIIYLNATSDGNFPNHTPDPSLRQNNEQLCEAVKKHHADLGIGLDGDGDRVGFVDEKGQMVLLDLAMIPLCRYLLPQMEDKRVLVDVRCTNAFIDAIDALGGSVEMYRVGNSFIKAHTKALDIKIAFELSGHVYLRLHENIDDGLYVALLMLRMLSHHAKTFSQLVADRPIYYTSDEFRLKTTEQNKETIVKKIIAYCDQNALDYICIDGVRINYSDGWVLVRASSTGPIITFRVEASTKERKRELIQLYSKLINKFM